jgi:hypothetical protein
LISGTEVAMTASRWSIAVSVIVAASGASLAAPPTGGSGNALTPGALPSATMPTGMPWPMAGAVSPSEARYPFDAQEAWIHGYFQDAPAYGGFNAFRPYNYKHVLIQSQIVAGWGLSPNMPYAQQLWRSSSQTAMCGGAAVNQLSAVETHRAVSSFATSSSTPRIVPGVVLPASAEDSVEHWPLGLGHARQH